MRSTIYTMFEYNTIQYMITEGGGRRRMEEKEEVQQKEEEEKR